MKEFLKQFYTEGLAATFYQRPKKFLSKRIKNKVILNILTTLLLIFYTLIVLGIAGFYLYKKLK